MIGTCEICGEPMPVGEEMFKFHGLSGPCPKPPLPVAPTQEQNLKPPGLMWAIAGKDERDVKMRFDTPGQANAFVAGLIADETPNVKLRGAPLLARPSRTQC